ncbi:phosphotransferase family protein [Streptomyces prunicolor]|uniref:phosphotransferase family protein n=1 Tax=Streptomyces prunicolor TaxID=67348 RepID=UPI00342E8C4E
MTRVPHLVPEVVDDWSTDEAEVVLQRWIDAPTLLETTVSTTTSALAGAALGDIHRQRGPYAGSLDGRFRFANQAEAFGSRWRHALGLVSGEYPVLARRLGDWAAPRLAAMPRYTVHRLVHGDFGPTNILVSGVRCLVIDWEHARWGDPYEDLAKIRVARRFPEPNGFGAEPEIWSALTAAWARTADVTWECPEPTMELYETYYVMCLAMFFDDVPNRRLARLEHLTAHLA